jgi:signal transduction histidine kinase
MEEKNEAERALAEVLRRVADTRHDIKNPLSIISGNVQLLREMARVSDLDDDFREALYDIGEATEHVRDLLDQMDDL